MLVLYQYDFSYKDLCIGRQDQHTRERLHQKETTSDIVLLGMCGKEWKRGVIIFCDEIVDSKE